MPPTIGLVHPGEMGGALAASLVQEGRVVRWASEARSAASAARAEAAGLADAGSLAELANTCTVLLSVCPPHAAIDVARQVAEAGFAGTYVDANAVSPATALAVAEIVGGAGAEFVDGGVIGPPPRSPGSTRLYLSGAKAPQASEWLKTSVIEVRIVSSAPGAASAMKLAYAAWTKGSAALLIAIRAAARASEVESALLAEWDISLPDLAARSKIAARSGDSKGWRWCGEMEEIADMFADLGLPDGFHRAAATVFEDLPWRPEE